MVERRSHRATVECGAVAELLPFFLNRSLEGPEAREVEAHLAACTACRREERDTRAARDLYEGHLPVDLLLEHAFAEPMSPRRRSVIESHLAVCERCSQEVAAVRREAVTGTASSSAPSASPGTRTAAAARVQPALPRKGRGRLRMLAWAACLAAFVASAGWIWTWRQLVDERTPPLDRAARANLTVLELLPGTSMVLRRGGADPRDVVNQVGLSDDAGELVLVLLSGGRWCTSGCFLELYDAGEMFQLTPPKTTPQRRIEGLVSSPDGHVTLSLPREWLSSDRSILALRDQSSGELVVEYRVELLAPKRAG